MIDILAYRIMHWTGRRGLGGRLIGTMAAFHILCIHPRWIGHGEGLTVLQNLQNGRGGPGCEGLNLLNSRCCPHHLRATWFVRSVIIELLPLNAFRHAVIEAITNREPITTTKPHDTYPGPNLYTQDGALTWFECRQLPREGDPTPGHQLHSCPLHLFLRI